MIQQNRNKKKIKGQVLLHIHIQVINIRNFAIFKLQVIFKNRTNDTYNTRSHLFNLLFNISIITIRNLLILLGKIIKNKKIIRFLVERLDSIHFK